MSTREPPKAPTILFVGDKTRAWQAPRIYRLPALYATATTVACQPLPDAADARLRPAAGRSTISLNQHQVYPVADDAVWQQIESLRAVWQVALDDLATALRALGSYATQLAANGGPAVAPNPLSPLVIVIDDPDRDRDRQHYYHPPVPRIRLESIIRHTPKMLSNSPEGDPRAYLFTQDDAFACPDDATWDRMQALHQAAQDAASAWQAYLDTTLHPYDRAPAAAPPTAIVPAAMDGVIMLSEPEARVLVDRIKTNLETIRSDLLALHDQEGWRALGYDTWRACVMAEFGTSQSYLYRQLAAALLERDLGFAIGETPESHLRPLTRMAPAQARQVLAHADQLADGGPRQAAHVVAAKQAIAPPPVRPAPPPPPPPPRMPDPGCRRCGQPTTGVLCRACFEREQAADAALERRVQATVAALPVWAVRLFERVAAFMSDEEERLAALLLSLAADDPQLAALLLPDPQAARVPPAPGAGDALAVIPPGITLDTGYTWEDLTPLDRFAVWEAWYGIDQAEQGNSFAGSLQTNLEGVLDLLSDESYTALATRLSVLQEGGMG